LASLFNAIPSELVGGEREQGDIAGALDGFHELALVDGRRRQVPQGREGSRGAFSREAFVRKKRGPNGPLF